MSEVCLDEWYMRRSQSGILHHLRYIANKTTVDTGLYRLIMNSNGVLRKETFSFPSYHTMGFFFTFTVTVDVYLIKSRILDEADPPSAFYTDQEIKLNDSDFAACVDYNRLLNNSIEGFLTCSHKTGKRFN